MPSVRIMRIDIGETEKSFNINGVAFSKARLAELFPEWGCDLQAFYRYLLIMPFFATTKDPATAPGKAGKYAILKARRIYPSVGLNEDDSAIVAFMHVAAQMGNLKLPEELGLITDQCHDQICDCGEKKSPRRETLH
jgi:hypothetical protein